MSQWNPGGLVVGSVSGFIAAWIVILVSRPRGVTHPLYFPIAGAAIMIGLLLVYLTFDVDAVVAGFSRREIESASQLFWFAVGFAYTIVCGIALTTSGIVDLVRIVRSRRE
jgi:hypothetical protein